MTSLVKSYTFHKTSIALAALFLIGFLGFLQFSMLIMDSSMSDCPLMPDATVCTMTPLEHVGAWQAVFTSLPHSGSIFQILFLLVVASVYAYHLIRFQSISTPLHHVFSLHDRRFYRNQFSPVLHLQEAFSEGILNTKLF